MLPGFFTQHTIDWFQTAVGEPTAVQEMGWRAVAGGGDVLISAPTGTGKTLTAFLYWLDYLYKSPKPLGDECVIIYISPLKALGNDIRENLQKPLAGLGLSGVVRTGVRTGDTPASERARLVKRPPHILITTPESLYLMLTSEKSRKALATARCVIIDEVHSVIGSKRGTHLMLSLERLDALCQRRLQRIALSATIRPLEGAADYISGGRGAQIVAPAISKAIEVNVELAEKDLRVLPQHSVWPDISDKAYRLSQSARTTLAFVDGRSQAEKLAYGINAIAGGQYARTHHGCVSKEQRLEAENQLRAGELKILCCTSSMELGIDVGDIDLVLQVGAPRSISGALQRAGRAGHGPGRVSRLTIFPKTESDALAAALAARGALEGRIETAHAPRKCLDVVSQQLVSMAVSNEYTVEEALEIVRGAWPCREVTREELEGVLRMLAGDFEHDRDLPVRPRIIYDRIHGKFSGDTYTRMLAVSTVGTIPDRGWYTVALPDGTRLGELDEEYVFEARLGDKFLLGAFAWRITDITRDRVIVTAASTEGAASPFWKGDSMGRPLETGMYYGGLLREMNAAQVSGKMDECLKNYPLTPDAKSAVKHYVKNQFEATGCMPDDRTIIAEHFADSAGEHQLMIHSIFGARVNHALSMLVRHEAQRRTGLDVRGYDDDDGMLLYLIGGSELPEGLVQGANPDNAKELIDALLPAEPMFSMAYRYAAARADMMGTRGKGRQPLWVQRLRGAESLSGAVAQKGHPLIYEALRECREDTLDVEGAISVLRAVRAGDIRVLEMHTNAASPMSLSLRRQVEAELLYESVIPVKAYEESRKKVAAMAPARAAVEKRYERVRKIDGVEALHSVLMAEGDLLSGETDAPAEWFEELSRAGRAEYVEPGLWIAAEHAEEYTSGDYGRIARRCLRYRGAQDERTIAQRYSISESRAREMLLDMENKGEAVKFEDMYIHADVYSSAQHLTIAMLRSEVRTVAPEKFARMLAMEACQPGAPKARLTSAMGGLLGLELPAAAWEEMVLPARAQGYRPDLLDSLLAEGAVTWRLRNDDGKYYVTFLTLDDFDFDEYAPVEGALTEDEGRVLKALEKGGAQFDYAISKRLGGISVGTPLQRLAEMGLARQDSFAPVRRALSPMPRRGYAQLTGRWERTHAARKLTAKESIEAQWRNYPILCRETCRDMQWQTALENLRVMEAIGEARRGYFVSGLSGAQFVKSEDFQQITAALSSESDDYACLNAADPAQAWGKYLRHTDGLEFMCVPGTAVVTHSGAVICVFERQGAALRIFSDGENGVKCFADAFRGRRIFPTKQRICVKEYPREAGKWLENAGFTREALDYVLFSD